VRTEAFVEFQLSNIAGIQLEVVVVIIIIQLNSILYFNVLTQQLQEPITKSAQVDKYIHSKENNNNNRNKESIQLIS
jgi:hypothetical protein